MERLWSENSDGTRVPITLVQSRHLRDSTPAPTLALVYGAYGHSLEPSKTGCQLEQLFFPPQSYRMSFSSSFAGFNAAYLSLLQRGFRIAYCHVRGGAELGAEWHDAGRLLHKTNTFRDLKVGSN